MSVVYSLRPVDQISDRERAGITSMKTAVYPPRDNEDWPGRDREWLAPGWIVLVSQNGEIVSCTGIVKTEAEIEGQTVVIGGVGGIATHPDHRGRGYAELSVNRAIEWMSDQAVEFALLVCRDELVPYYSKRGWQVFEGTLVVRQFGEPETFTFNNVMVRPVCRPAPKSGVVDLLGPPW